MPCMAVSHAFSFASTTCLRSSPPCMRFPLETEPAAPRKMKTFRQCMGEAVRMPPPSKPLMLGGLPSCFIHRVSAYVAEDRQTRKGNPAAPAEPWQVFGGRIDRGVEDIAGQ